MLLVDDAVDDGVAEVHVGACHVYLGAKHHRALGQLAAVHLLKKCKTLLCGTVAVRTRRAGLRRRPLLGGYLLARLLVHVCLSLLDEAHGEVPKLLEIVGRMVDVAPLEAEPLYVLLDGLHVLRVLFLRIGVVKAQVAHSAEFLSHPEVHAYGLGVPYVQIAVGLGREARLKPPPVLALLEVVLYNLLDEVQAPSLRSLYAFVGCHNRVWSCTAGRCPPPRKLSRRTVRVSLPFRR